MPTPPMKYSKDGLALTERFESCRLTAYLDSRGTATLGWGHTLGVHLGMTCTQAVADAWLQQDIKWAEGRVNADVHVPLLQGEFDALVDFVFNTGSHNFETSTLLKLVNKGDLTDAANEFAKWDKAGGREIAGLLRRRMAEKQEFTHDVA